MVDVADCPRCGKRTLILKVYKSGEIVPGEHMTHYDEIWGECYSCGWRGKVH